MREALELVDAIRKQPNPVLMHPGPRHWDIFRRLPKRAASRGTWFRTPIMRHWRSNSALNGSRPTGTTPGSPVSNGAIHSPNAGRPRD